MSAPVENAPLFRRLALVGIGLIGSSVARIARERGDIAAEVVVTARTPRTLERVRQLGFADRVEADPRAAVDGADAVMLCAPVGAYALPHCLRITVGDTEEVTAVIDALTAFMAGTR